MSILSEAVARLLMAPALMVAAALLIKGYAGVGDGFSAGVVVALAVAVQYLVLGAEQTEEEIPALKFAPRAAIAGLVIALGSGFFPLLQDKPLFSHLPGPKEDVVHVGTLELITPMIFDVGVFLLIAGALITLIHVLAQPPEEIEGSGVGR